MGAQKLPPVPIQSPMLDVRGYLTPVWADWFKHAFNRMGGHTAKTNLELEDAASVSGTLASEIAVIPAGAIISTNVQAALEELDAIKVPVTRQINGKLLNTNISISASDIGLGSVRNLDCTDPSNIVQDATHRFVTDSEKNAWNETLGLMLGGDDSDYIDGKVDGGVFDTFFGIPDGGDFTSVYTTAGVNGGTF